MWLDVAQFAMPAVSVGAASDAGALTWQAAR